MDARVAARRRLDVILAADVARVAVRGEDEFDLQVRSLLDDLLRRQARVDDDRLLAACVRDEIAVDLAVELDLDDRELAHCITI